MLNWMSIFKKHVQDNNGDVNFYVKDNILYISFSIEEITFANGIHIKDELKKFPTDIKEVEINLQGVRYIDSSGIGMLIQIAMHFQNKIIKLKNVKYVVIKTLEILNLSNLFSSIEKDEKQN
jgi:stage II sporulation protein AA (anti-sigma F factor antagonist)